MAEFAPAIKIVLKHEGGYVNNPSDPGGETNFGISKAQYPNVDIAGLTEKTASDIYYRDYWLKNSLDKINDQNVANFALDTVVHHGQGPRLLQEAVNESGAYTEVDNAMGPNTVNAINSVSATTFLKNAIGKRLAYMDSLVERNPALKQFLTGWKMRVRFFFIRPYLIPGGIALLALGTFLYLRMKGNR